MDEHLIANLQAFVQQAFAQDLAAPLDAEHLNAKAFMIAQSAQCSPDQAGGWQHDFAMPYFLPRHRRVFIRSAGEADRLMLIKQNRVAVAVKTG